MGIYVRPIALRLLLAFATVSPWACGCDDEPPPAGGGGNDFPDLGVLEGSDVGPDPRIDGGPLPTDDATVDPDGGPSNDGALDGSTSDVSTPDVGFVPGDRDLDTIYDAEEGNGAVDTDQDGITDDLDTDSDNDGILDRIEAGDGEITTRARDIDRDNIPDFRDRDSDNDLIDDDVEGTEDTDHDGAPDYIDTDSDGDGIFDRVEGVGDPDSDGFANYVDRDSDGDGILDRIETGFDTDGDGTPNFLDLDSDADGISDRAEGILDPDNDHLPAFVDLDADGDGIYDAVETATDRDGDGVGNWLDADSDGDLIRDSEEGLADWDLDGIPSYLDLDSDDDGIVDEIEAGDGFLSTSAADHDFDGAPDFRDLDSDADSIPDAVEGDADFDGDGLAAFADVDADGDSITDAVEAGDSDLLTAPIDTDGDGAPDYLDLDSDGDTITDDFEPLDSNDDGIGDRVSLDSDGDGLSDAIEAGDSLLATAPIDTDGDGRYDFRDLDSDGDGLGDAIETGCPSSTERLEADSDFDGYLDTAELAMATLPCDASSGVPGFYFVLPPLGPTATDDLVFDDTGIDRADLAIEIDTTGSMGGEITNLRNSLATLIIPGAQAVVPDPAFAVSSFEDFPIDPFGSSSDLDRPFTLGTRVTTDQATAQAAINALATKNGGDLPEAGLEALYQLATGAGASWGPGPSDRLAAFDGAAGMIPGVADGTIGGVGFRPGALPIVVHVTDAPSQTPTTYAAASSAISAATPSNTLDALGAIGARVITIASTALGHPVEAAVFEQAMQASCTRASGRTYGRIEGPTQSDVDWYRLIGATVGQTVTVSVTAEAWGSTLDSLIAIYDRNGVQVAVNDDAGPGSNDSSLSVVLAGTAPFYLAVGAFNDTDFNGTGAVTSGFYFLDVVANGRVLARVDAGCAAVDEGDSRSTATFLSPIASLSPAGDVGTCVATCEALIADDQLRLPYGISRATGAAIPACAWDLFGVGRPASCAADQCCTGLDGAGEAADSDAMCPLSFRVDGSGAGLGQAVVDGLEALVQFSEFTITTAARPDPVALNAGVDTTCFLHGVIPTLAVTANSCAPTPSGVDLMPPALELDSYARVTPGTELHFAVNAINRVGSSATPCVEATDVPQLFHAYIDVVADGVTVVDTREVTIVVPPALGPGNN